ncbi:MAG: nucleotidyltransferase domain-containing protein [Candidatus Protochlamydia sp.]|nr:nucleotidyltransferase domain-containing protein [Candidatus Protochlamydia sp.]
MYGLTTADMITICNVLRKYPAVHEAILFGSRAKGTNSPGSDVDIALKGNDLENEVLQISTYLNEESLLPYCFDIINYQTLDNEKLIEHINRVGKVLYTFKAE